MYGSYEKLVLDATMANDCTPTANITMYSSAANVMVSKPFMEPATISRFGIRVTEAIVHDVAGQNLQVTLYRLPGALADANRVSLGVLNVPLGNYAANTVFFCDVGDAFVAATKVLGAITVRARNKADLDVGDAVQIAVTANMTGTNHAGSFQPYVCYNYRPEAPGNEALVVDLTP